MAQRVDRRPGDKSGPELPQEVLARQKLEAGMDARTKETRRALEKAQGGQEVDAEAAAQLQQSMGNLAMQAMVKEGTDTDTATTSAEATLDRAREDEVEEEQEEDKDKDAGELEQILPSFSTGGGGGGGSGGGGGNSPWALGRMFGGDGDPEAAAVAGPAKWRPMPLPPDPDEDVELEDCLPDDVPTESLEAPLAEADARFGGLPWSPGVLSRGLRHPGRLVRRGIFDAAGSPDAVWSRARSALRFLAEHAPDDEARTLAAGGAAIGIGHDVPLVVALAQELAILEGALAGVGGAWHAVVDAAADQRARPRVEAAAALLAPGALSAAALLAATLGSEATPAEGDGTESAHPAASAALAAAARLGTLPRVEAWRRAAPDPDAVADAELDAIDALLRAETGGQEPTLPSLESLYAQLNASLTALGGVQVEVAAAALAAWPWLGDGVAEAATAALDARLRQLARRLVAAGRAVEAAHASGDIEAVEGAVAEAVALASTGEFVRSAALVALAGPLLDPTVPPAPPPDEAWERRRASGQSAALRAELNALPAFAAFPMRARLDGAFVAGKALEGLGGGSALLHAGACLSGGAEEAAAIRLAAWVGEAAPGPYGLVWAAVLAARARRDPSLLEAAAPAVRAHGDSGALNLLKAAWTELALDREIASG